MHTHEHTLHCTCKHMLTLILSSVLRGTCSDTSISTCSLRVFFTCQSVQIRISQHVHYNKYTPLSLPLHSKSFLTSLEHSEAPVRYPGHGLHARVGCQGYYVTLHRLARFTCVCCRKGGANVSWRRVARGIKNRYLDEVSTKNRYRSPTNQITIFEVTVL